MIILQLEQVSLPPEDSLSAHRLTPDQSLVRVSRNCVPFSHHVQIPFDAAECASPVVAHEHGIKVAIRRGYANLFVAVRMATRRAAQQTRSKQAAAESHDKQQTAREKREFRFPHGFGVYTLGDASDSQIPPASRPLRHPPPRPGRAIPAWATSREFTSITRTADELSIVCPAGNIPKDVAAASRWTCLKLEGPFLFSQTGILLSFIQPLSGNGVPIFAVCTYDTDYISDPGRATCGASVELLPVRLDTKFRCPSEILRRSIRRCSPRENRHTLLPRMHPRLIHAVIET